jgi:hypothetical protein
MAEKGLILVRVMMTVIYGHVIHSLRRASAQTQSTQQAPTTTFNQHIESFTIEELHRVKTMLEQQTQGMQRSSTPAPSSPRAWKRTPISSFQRSNNVHVQQARNFHSQRQSRYRKQFVASRESSTVVDNESSIMKAESTDESSATDESRAVGEEEASPLPFSRM